MTDLLSEFFLKNWKIKVYSLVISLGLWLVVLGQRNYIVTKEVSIEYLLDQNYILEGEPKVVELTLEGKRQALKGLTPSQISVFVDLRGQLTGFKRVKIPKKNISLPVGIKLVNSEPEVVDFTLRLRPISS